MHNAQKPRAFLGFFSAVSPNDLFWIPSYTQSNEKNLGRNFPRLPNIREGKVMTKYLDRIILMGTMVFAMGFVLVLLGIN